MCDYNGDNIQIEEMPYGCVIHSIINMDTVVVYSKEDALALINSLTKMVSIMERN